MQPNRRGLQVATVLIGSHPLFIRLSFAFANQNENPIQKNTSPHSPSLRALPRENLSCPVWANVSSRASRHCGWVKW
jgi:hypothetical protein